MSWVDKHWLPSRPTIGIGVIVLAGVLTGAAGYTAVAQFGDAPVQPASEPPASVVVGEPAEAQASNASGELTKPTGTQRSANRPAPAEWDPVRSSGSQIAADVDSSRQFYGGASVGDSCETAEEGARGAEHSPWSAVLAPFGQFADDGSCTIGGWVYEVLPDDIGEYVELRVYRDLFILAPIFDDSGELIGYMDPPDTIADSSQFPSDLEDWPREPVTVGD